MKKSKNLTAWDKGIRKIRRQIETRITDKDRLDWVQKEWSEVWCHENHSWVVYSKNNINPRERTLRQAIDSAIKAARKSEG